MLGKRNKLMNEKNLRNLKNRAHKGDLIAKFELYNYFVDEDKVKAEVQLAKPQCYVTTPITSAIKAFKLMNIKKIAVFTPYPESVNKTIYDYFSKKNIEVLSFGTFNLELDSDFANIDPEYLSETLIKLNTSGADALFISCTISDV